MMLFKVLLLIGCIWGVIGHKFPSHSGSVHFDPYRESDLKLSHNASVSSAHYGCVVSFMVGVNIPSVPEDVDVDASVDTTVTIDDIEAHFAGRCVSSLDSPSNNKKGNRGSYEWNYKVCFDDLKSGEMQSVKVEQFKGADRYILGTKQTHYGEKGLLFADGDDCPDHDPRKTYVEFRCAPESPVDFVYDSSEPSTCTYNLVIGTARVCTDPSFNIIPVTQGNGMKIMDSSEDWFLELSENEDGAAQCSFYSTEEALGRPAASVFTDFSLAVFRTRDGSLGPMREMRASVTARGKQRELFPDESFAVSKNDASKSFEVYPYESSSAIDIGYLQLSLD